MYSDDLLEPGLEAATTGGKTATLLEVFDEHFKNHKFNQAFIDKVYRFQVWYLNRNPEHLAFFGGHYLGVNVIRFKDSDVLKLFNEVYDVDLYAVERDIKTVAAINPDFKVSSDTLNLTTFYVIHRILTSPLLDEKKRARGAYDAGLIFFYRCIAAIQSDWITHPIDPDIAKLAYARLSQKFLIKKLGSWHKVMDYRSKDLTGPKGIHYHNLIGFKDDYAIVYAINDSQGRIRDLMKGYYSEFDKVHSGGEHINTTGNTTTDIDGEEVSREKTEGVERYVTAIKSVISDKRSFVREDLIGVISKINTNTSQRMIRQTLEWMSDAYGMHDHFKLVDEFITKVVVHSMYLIQNNMQVSNQRDYPKILVNLKNLYLSTRSTDADLEEIRALGEKIVKASSPVKISQGLMMSTRTSIILYVSLRALIGAQR